MYISHTVDTDEEDMLSNEFKTFDTFDHCLYNSPSRLSGLNYPVIRSICHLSSMPFILFKMQV